MIAIEPAPSKSFSVGACLRKRELAHFLACAAQAIGLDGEVSVLLTRDGRIRSLNREFRGLDKSTDVLSFPAFQHFDGHGQAGDLAISLDTASRQATECGHPLQTEVKILMLHGLLHLAAFDHETDSGEMARLELKLRKKFSLPLGLIERQSLPTSRGARANVRTKTRTKTDGRITAAKKLQPSRQSASASSIRSIRGAHS